MKRHEILVMAQLLKVDAPDYPKLPNDILGKIKYAVSVYSSILKPHIDFEEEELFPLISGVSEEIDQLIYMLQDDHTEIENLFQKIPLGTSVRHFHLDLAMHRDT